MMELGIGLVLLLMFGLLAWRFGVDSTSLGRMRTQPAEPAASFETAALDDALAFSAHAVRQQLRRKNGDTMLQPDHGLLIRMLHEMGQTGEQQIVRFSYDEQQSDQSERFSTASRRLRHTLERLFLSRVTAKQMTPSGSH
jgi:hypothetical protein